MLVNCNYFFQPRLCLLLAPPWPRAPPFLLKKRMRRTIGPPSPPSSGPRETTWRTTGLLFLLFSAPSSTLALLLSSSTPPPLLARWLMHFSHIYRPRSTQVKEILRFDSVYCLVSACVAGGKKHRRGVGVRLLLCKSSLDGGAGNW